jgi:plastocyanin
MRNIVALVVASGLVVAASPAVAATPALRGSVGPGDTIRLVTKPKKGGLHRLTVKDLADDHNFRLRGPGVNLATGVGATGTRTFRVRLQPGKTYRFVCDPHADEMRGAFTVPR